MSEMQGLFGKYIVQKADGTPIDPKAVYFVLRLDTDEAARMAALEYARQIWRKNPQLSTELRGAALRYGPAGFGRMHVVYRVEICPKCRELVTANWLVRHLKSGCRVGICTPTPQEANDG